MTTFTNTRTRTAYGRPIGRRTPATGIAAREAAALAAKALPFARDLTIVAGVMALYFLARGQAPLRIDASVALTQHLVGIEKALHIFWEPAIQDWSIRYHWSRELANFTYAYLHFPVMAAVGVWLWFRDRQAFAFMRNVLFVSMVIGLVFYFTMPAAPPRLMALHGYDMGFIDTVFSPGTSVNYAQPGLIVNEYAAIPSFHFGWIALAAAAVWANTRSSVMRTGAIALVVLMTWAIVATANHLFIDMALGGLVVAASWRIAERIGARSSAAPADAPAAALPMAA